MHRRVALLLFAAGWGANHFATLLIVYRQRLGLSASALGLLFGAYAVGLVPGLVLAGRASDRRGRRPVVLAASAMAILASALLAFGARGFAVLFAGRLLYGIAMGSVMSPGSVWVQELSSPELGPRRATLALSAGFGMGPLVSGVIAEWAPAPMVLPYVVHAGLMACAIAAAHRVPETASLLERAARANEPARARHGLHLRSIVVLAELLPSAPWAFGFAAFTMAILPGLMRPLVSRPVLYASFVIVTTLASGVAVQPLTTRIGRRADLWGLGLGAAGIFLGAHALVIDSPRVVFAVAVLIGAGYGLVITSGLRDIAARVPRSERGTVVGIYYVLTYIGFALPFVHATLAATRGDVVTVRLAGVAAIICWFSRVLISARRARHDQRASSAP